MFRQALRDKNINFAALADNADDKLLGGAFISPADGRLPFTITSGPYIAALDFL